MTEGTRDLERLARILDNRFRVPGTGWRFGLDALIGLLPGVGDGATALLALYIIARASRLGVPKIAILKMLGNVGVDLLLGSIPVIGDVFDVGWQANQRNIDLLMRYLRK